MEESFSKNKKAKLKWEKPTITKLELSETLGKELPGGEASSSGGKRVIATS